MRRGRRGRWCGAARLATSLGMLAALGTASQDAGVRSYRLGVLFWHDSPNDAAAFQGMRRAMETCRRPHEWVVREAHESEAEAAAILRGFREDGVDLVFAMGTQAALLARRELTELPVVFTAVTHPVESGVTPSWEGSGTNVAGNSNWIAPETLMHVFRLAVPDLGRLGMLRSRESGVVSAAERTAMQRFLEQPGAPAVEILERVVGSAEELGAAAQELMDRGAQALWIPIDFVVYENMEPIVAAARPRRVPLVSSSLRGTNTGAVAGILVDYEMLGARAVVLALDILEKGAAPGDLPVGTMQGFQVVVNLDAARASGYELPIPLLAVADRILEDVEQERP